MTRTVNSLRTITNTKFYDFKSSQNILASKSLYACKNITYAESIEAINSKCKSLLNEGFSSFDLDDRKEFIQIAFDNYKKLKRNDEEKLIFKIDQFKTDYTITTGNYCGTINLNTKNDLSIVIETGLSDKFFKRILNFCCGIYADTNDSKETEVNESLYSLLVQYLYLMSLRKVAYTSFPKKYTTVNSRGYDINGNVDINAFINKDLLMFDKKISYSYQKRLEIQTILDVLYTALKSCKIHQNKEVLPEINRFQNYLVEMYSGKRPSKFTVNNILKEKCLFNSLYSSFKRPLEYAKILINSNDINSGNKTGAQGISGFLVDSSFLWEMYLYNLMRINLPDWDIESQSVISFYDDTFFHKNNYPDFVLRNKRDKRVFVLDAKFKKMDFKNRDVDNDDIRQLHAYSYFFSLTDGENFKGAGLIYPTKMDKPEGLKTADKIYGIKNSSCKFGVFAIKDPKEKETIKNNELLFIEELKQFLES